METNINKIQSRRSFFKNLAKATLPIISAAVVSNLPLKIQAATPGICSGCVGYCTGCQFSCDKGCSRSCKTMCDGCDGTCSGSATNKKPW